MQFVTNGPDIPDSLLQAHEDGRVAFFCGAGISYPAGLPGFRGLVDKVYHLIGTNLTDIEENAYARGNFDATLDLLERRLPGTRLELRTKLLEALKPNLRRKGATDTHSALLQLATNREGSLRLVTTNFDRVFEWVTKRDKQTINSFVAPTLPIPKNSRWNGLVYLHGLLPKHADTSALHRLVLTSGDFGLAYLIERWAARFVSELFRNYVVCFVGYSINDPVLRYMMDALAADRMLGEVTPQAYALGDCQPGQASSKTIEWKAKGVTPILYEVPKDSSDHSALHRTLKAWAEVYRDGVLGKERIVIDHAMARPSASTRQDDFVGRMLWALSHESGLPARRFADLDPVPPLDWLEAFSDDRYQHGDLQRFGVPPRPGVDERLRFSLIRRPAPYGLASWMSPVSSGSMESQWDSVMFHLGRWLVRHLNDPALIIWLAKRGGQLHERWAWLIERELEHLSKLEREGNDDELERIRSRAPNAIPNPFMKTIWRLLLTGRVKQPSRHLDIFRWKGRLKREGLTTTMRLELRELLAAKVVLRTPIPWGTQNMAGDWEPHSQRIDWDLELASDHVNLSIADLATTEQWQSALPGILDDVQQLLRDALDLLRELGEAQDRNDRSHWYLSSISPHWQNQDFKEWVALIELLRDAWLAVRAEDPQRAIRIAQGWFAVPYPTFKRLALFAACQDGCIDSDRWVDWLLLDDAWWLWAVETQRESMRLLVLQGVALTQDAKTRLENAILSGPPRVMFRVDIEPAQWQGLVDQMIWLRLAKLQSGGCTLGHDALQWFTAITVANPHWKLASDESDEFSHWMSGSEDTGYERDRNVEATPRKREDLVQWLKLAPAAERRLSDEVWRDICRRHSLNAGYALWDLSLEGNWPHSRWREALQVWSEGKRARRSWKFFAPLVQAMPEQTLQEVAHSVTRWLQAVTKSMDHHEAILFDLCRRLMTMMHKDGVVTDQPVLRALNHPIGHVTQALLNLWFKRKPGDNDTLDSDIEPLFTKLCDLAVESYCHGRVLLASRLISLYRVDRLWTEKHLLPLFDWGDDPLEARAAWAGFLWSPRLYRPLLVAFKRQFLETAHHYAELGEHKRQFATFLTYAALDPIDGYLPQDFQHAVGALPTEALPEIANALVHALEGAGEQREDYWRNRIQPFWHKVWPKSRELASSTLSLPLARLSIAAREQFHRALATTIDWLRPIEHPYLVVHSLYESDLPKRFPRDSLRLLLAVHDERSMSSRELRKCLETIVQVEPDLKRERGYQVLMQHAQL